MRTFTEPFPASMAPVYRGIHGGEYDRITCHSSRREKAGGKGDRERGKGDRLFPGRNVDEDAVYLLEGQSPEPGTEFAFALGCLAGILLILFFSWRGRRRRA